MATVPLTKGKVALIDDEDAERVTTLPWYAFLAYVRADGTEIWYAVRDRWVDGNRRFLYMHRFVLGYTDNDPDVDHINGNGLDNRKQNLRDTNPSLNALNATRKVREHTPYRGVIKRESGRYGAYATYRQVRYNLGTYDTMEGAARAYDAFHISKGHGAARLNFPDEVPTT